MTRVTKKMLIDEIFEVVEEYSNVTRELLTLLEEKKITYGEYELNGVYNQYGYLRTFGGQIGDISYPVRLYGWRKEETTVRDFKYYLNDLKKSLQKAKDLIAERKGE